MTRISINFIVPSVNHFSCSNFNKMKLSENYLDNSILSDEIRVTSSHLTDIEKKLTAASELICSFDSFPDTIFSD